MPDARTWWGRDEGFEPVVQVRFDQDEKIWRADHFPDRGDHVSVACADLTEALRFAVETGARFELIDPLDNDVLSWPDRDKIAELEHRAAASGDVRSGPTARRIGLALDFSVEGPVFQVSFLQPVSDSDPSFRDGLDGVDGTREEVWELSGMDVREALAWTDEHAGERQIVIRVLVSEDDDGSQRFVSLLGEQWIQGEPG